MVAVGVGVCDTVGDIVPLGVFVGVEVPVDIAGLVGKSVGVAVTEGRDFDFFVGVMVGAL